jgi:4-hydroxythreonine-4-phosphate dehydrogenase
MQSLPRLALTMGDVNGIGPEIIARALAQREACPAASITIVGAADTYEEARRFSPGAPPAVPISSPNERVEPEAGVAIWNPGAQEPELQAGRCTPEASSAAVVWIEETVRAIQAGHFDAIVTCPISKAGVFAAGYHYNGHTQLIAELCGVDDYRMCLFTDTMRIVHITGHLSLRDALDAVTRDRIARSVRIGYDALRRLELPNPRIAVAGLNPHAGEEGAYGREEIDEIAPAVAACQAAGIPCTGPYPPDTLFKRMYDGEFDMVIAMYHDQGHIPLKLIAMDEGVNVTLGLPLVRTSVDHGTAYDIAWKGIAREQSLIASLNLAARLHGSRAIKEGS